MNYLSLFSGAGGGDLAAQHFHSWRCLGYVEYADYPQRVLKARIQDGHLNEAPIFGDIRTFISEGYAERYRGMVDVITAGFPCQPFSVAGKQAAVDDPRNMWPATIECIRTVRPRYCLLENVPGLLAASHGYFGTILRELAESGYSARWRVLSAAELGAPHKRDRLWIVAYSDGKRQRQSENKTNASRDRGAAWMGINECDSGRKFFETCEEMADANGRRCEQRNTPEWSVSELDEGGDVSNTTAAGLERAEPARDTCADGCAAKSGQRGREADWWSVEPNVGRVAHGVANRVDRLKAIGNGQVPQVAARAWELLTE